MRPAEDAVAAEEVEAEQVDLTTRPTEEENMSQSMMGDVTRGREVGGLS